MHKIGILGAAGIAPRSIIQPARRQGETIIHAVASRRPGAAQVYADTHRIPVAYSSYDALLADPEITELLAVSKRILLASLSSNADLLADLRAVVGP